MRRGKQPRTASSARRAADEERPPPLRLAPAAAKAKSDADAVDAIKRQADSFGADSLRFAMLLLAQYARQKQGAAGAAQAISRSAPAERDDAMEDLRATLFARYGIKRPNRAKGPGRAKRSSASTAMPAAARRAPPRATPARKRS